jgi:hypothetical protein
MARENPLNPPNVNEVLRREANLRQESLRRETGDEDESGVRRNKSLIQKLVDRITGRSAK